MGTLQSVAEVHAVNISLLRGHATSTNEAPSRNSPSPCRSSRANRRKSSATICGMTPSAECVQRRPLVSWLKAAHWTGCSARAARSLSRAGSYWDQGCARDANLVWLGFGRRQPQKVSTSCHCPTAHRRICTRADPRRQTRSAGSHSARSSHAARSSGLAQGCSFLQKMVPRQCEFRAVTRNRCS